MKLIVTACLVLLAGCAPTGIAPGASPTLPTDWSIHEAAGLRIAAPTAWLGPEVLPALDSTGGPRAWIVFKDPSGAEALTLMTWRDTTASAVATTQFQTELPRGDLQDLTLSDGTRAAVAVMGYARWSDATAAGTYECRHLFVQVDPRSSPTSSPAARTCAAARLPRQTFAACRNGSRSASVRREASPRVSPSPRPLSSPRSMKRRISPRAASRCPRAHDDRSRCHLCRPRELTSAAMRTTSPDLRTASPHQAVR